MVKHIRHAIDLAFTFWSLNRIHPRHVTGWGGAGGGWVGPYPFPRSPQFSLGMPVGDLVTTSTPTVVKGCAENIA